MKTSKMLDGYPQRSCAAATLPPLARPPPIGAALPRRYAGPSLRSGDGRPRFGHGPAAGAAWRGLRRGLAIPRPAVTPSASTAGLRVELARWRSLALRLGRCPRRPRGPVPCGQSGPREDRRGSSRRPARLRRVLPRSVALRASGGGARGDAVRGSSPRAQPRLQSALGLCPRLRASFKSA